MRIAHLATALSCLLLFGCDRTAEPAAKFTEADVRTYMDEILHASLRKDAAKFCALTSKEAVYEVTYQPYGEGAEPIYQRITGEESCEMADAYFNVPELKVRRQSLKVDMAPDGQSATVFAEYEQTNAYYPLHIPPDSVDDYDDVAVIESRIESSVVMEAGRLTRPREVAHTRVVRLMPRSLPRATAD